MEQVTLARVSAALSSLLGTDGIDRALIFFAGHGLTTPFGGECWLPSDWQASDSTLSVRILRTQLERYGIAELAILSDACRTIAASQETVNLPAPGILPRGTLPQPIRRLDIFRAAPETRAAYMIPGPNPSDARCIFSALLTEALTGAHPAATDPEADQPGAITGASLATFLATEVPLRAGRYGVTLQPDVTPHFETARRVWSIMPTPPPIPAAWPDPANILIPMGSTTSGRIEPSPGTSWTNRTQDLTSAERDVEPLNFPDDALGLPTSEAGPDSHDPTQPAGATSTAPTLIEIITADSAAFAARATARASAHAAQLAHYAEERRPDHFETGAGLTIVGSTFTELALPPGNVIEGERDMPFSKGQVDRELAAAATVEQFDPSTFRVRQDSWDDYGGSSMANPYWRGQPSLQLPLPLLARLASSDWIATCAFPDFLTTHVVEKRGLISLIARKMRDTEAPGTEDAVARLATGTLAEAAPLDLAARLYQAPFPDPVLAILTAWRFDAIGDMGSVQRLAAHFAAARQPIPFDIALLADLPINRMTNGPVVAELAALPEEPSNGRPHWLHAATSATTAVIAGAVPFLTAGWELLDAGHPLAFSGFETILPHLRLAAPFTTLSPEGGTRLAQLLNFVTEYPQTQEAA